MVQQITPKPPVIGGFIAGTLVHTKEGLKPIEQIQVGDWVLSRPENPEEGTETAYKRVVNTFRFEDKPVVNFIWSKEPVQYPSESKDKNVRPIVEWVFATPNHPVWVDGHGWMAVERLHEPGKRKPGLLDYQEWDQPLLRLADGSLGNIRDVNDCFRTDQPHVVYTESTNDYVEWGSTWDFRESPPKLISNQEGYDFEEWTDPVNNDPIVFTTTVYNIEVEDWHTYFVGKMGLWVHTPIV